MRSRVQGAQPEKINGDFGLNCEFDCLEIISAGLFQGPSGFDAAADAAQRSSS